MQAAQRYPLEFDGVIAGAPAMRNNYAALGTDWINVQLNQVAPRDRNGQPVTRDALSSTQKQPVIAVAQLERSQSRQYNRVILTG